MIIRYTKDSDLQNVYDLHIASILYYCSDFYSKEVISAWIKLKTPNEYKNSPDHCVVLIAEIQGEIVGFGSLNLDTKNISGLYIKPNMSRKGIGKKILDQLESIAKSKGIEEINLSSTINAVSFYNEMGYSSELKTAFKLASGIEIECVKMIKKFND